MDEAIIRFLQGHASASEEAELQAWRRAVPENERRYAEICALWSATARTSRPATLPLRPSATELIEASALRARGPVTAAGTRRRWIAAALAAAALVLLVLNIPRLRVAPSGEDLFAATELTTGPSEMVTAQLRDGSVVRLAPNSRLRVTPTAHAREVWLEGKAFFAIAKQAGRPFIVRTRAGEALVLGTRFEVSVLETDLRVVVVEGRVALTAADATVEIGAGEMSHVVAGTAPSLERADGVEPELEWIKGFLVFQDTPLREVAREIERQYGVRVELPDDGLAERTVTASFTDRSVEEVLMVVCRVADARCTLRDSVASIEP